MKKRGFTLIELIVVITILSILGTIAFISLKGYSNDARDSVRTSDLSNINKGLALYKAKNSFYPLPDNFINIMNSGTVISKQGYAGEALLGKIGMKGVVDPLDKTYYTYSVNFNNKKAQTLALLEGDEVAFGLTTSAFANDKRSIKTSGDSVGIVTDSNNVPIQTTRTSDFDIKTDKTTEKVYFDTVDYGDDSLELFEYYTDPSLISLVNFNDTLKDSSKNFNTVEIQGSPVIAEGKHGQGLHIDGSGSGLKVNFDDKKLMKDKLTLSAWIKPNSNVEVTSLNGGGRCGMNSIIIRGASKGFYMARDYEGYMCGYRYKFTPAGYHNSTYQSQIGDWINIVQVWDGATLKFYVDGVQVGTDIATAPNVEGDYTDVGGAYYIGIERFVGDPGSLERYFDGIIDEVMVFNRDLSPSEIQKLYDLTK